MYSVCQKEGKSQAVEHQGIRKMKNLQKTMKTMHLCFIAQENEDSIHHVRAKPLLNEWMHSVMLGGWCMFYQLFEFPTIPTPLPQCYIIGYELIVFFSAIFNYQMLWVSTTFNVLTSISKIINSITKNLLEHKNFIQITKKNMQVIIVFKAI